MDPGERLRLRADGADSAPASARAQLTPSPAPPQDDALDAMFFLRVVFAAGLGVLFGVFAAQGLFSFVA